MADNIVHAGVLFIVFLFITVFLYFTLSGPIDTVMDGIAASPGELAEDVMNEFSPDLNWAVKAAFACGIATPITWFIFWVFSKEPFVGFKRRY